MIYSRSAQGEKKSDQLYALIKRAKCTLRIFIDHNNKRLTHPELFTSTLPTPKSELHWNAQKFTKRSLFELLVALDKTAAVVDVSGRAVTYIQLVEHFTKWLNMPFTRSYAYNERETILNIKQNPALFLKQLSASLTKASEK